MHPIFKVQQLPSRNCWRGPQRWASNAQTLSRTYPCQGCRGWPLHRTSGLMRCAEPVVLRMLHRWQRSWCPCSLIDAQSATTLAGAQLCLPFGVVSHWHDWALFCTADGSHHQSSKGAIQRQACCRAGHHQCSAKSHHQGGQNPSSVRTCTASALILHSVCQASVLNVRCM